MNSTSKFNAFGFGLAAVLVLIVLVGMIIR
ncbi:hypothetical protein BH10BAC5_BH10BAC5_16510 [soil metagenome]